MHRRIRTHKLRYIIASLAGLLATLATVAPWNAGASTSIVRYYGSREAAAGVKHYLGDRYVYGGTGPYSFDCSGLAQYVYAHYVGVSIPRTANDQYHWFRPESASHAWGGDLVFFHDSSGYVYHTGIYEGPGQMISALSSRYGVKWTPLSWGGSYVTYGTISH